MKHIPATIKRALLEIPLRRPSPDRVPRSGEQGMAVDCYTVRVFEGDGEEPLIVRSADGDTLNCLEYDGNRYSIESEASFYDLLGRRFEFIHYHGLCTTTYFGWFDLALGRIFRLPYLKAWIHTKYHVLSQGIYNRRKLVTKQRIDLLKVILDAQLNGRDRISSLCVMSLIHTDKWYLHPNQEDEHHRVEFYLDALVETNDLKANGIDYQITGQGIAAIELYEEQERKHSESIASQRRMFWLTIVIALLTVVQAGLIKLPPLLNLSGH
jgi:hypothetical protein